MAQPEQFKEQLESAIQYTREAFERSARVPCGSIEIRVLPALYDDVVEATADMDGVSVTAHTDMVVIFLDTPSGQQCGVIEPRA